MIQYINEKFENYECDYENGHIIDSLTRRVFGRIYKM